MASTQKNKKPKTKHPQGRPQSTSQLSQPAVQDASNLNSLSSFSPQGDLFAFISLAIDKHRLRIYNTTSGQAIAEHIVNAARVTALTWTSLNKSVDAIPDNPYKSPSKKKKTKSTTLREAVAEASEPTEAVALGLSNGTIIYFSPIHGRVVHTLSHPTSTSAILSARHITVDGMLNICTSGADGVIHFWDVQQNDIFGSWKNDDRIPYTSITIRPINSNGRIDILASHHSIHLLSKSNANHGLDSKRPEQLASFTGHVSSIKLTQWDETPKLPTRFVSMAEMDRFLYIWEFQEGLEKAPAAGPAASIPLDSDVRTFCLLNPSSTNKQILAALAASGKITLYPIPMELSSPASIGYTSQNIPVLVPRSMISFPNKGNFLSAQIINIAFTSEDNNNDKIRIARLVNGVRPVFDTIRFLDDSGNFIDKMTIEGVEGLQAMDSQPFASQKRYAETPSITIGTGFDIGQLSDDTPSHNIDGDLAVDVAELSLGQRLTAVMEPETRKSDSDEGNPVKLKSKSSKRAQNWVTVVPANSLTRTLIQALHSSDTKLLETCLAHSDPALIRNTVNRLPPQLATPLIIACVERLGKGARSSNMKGGGGGASSQRGMGLLNWLKTVLAIHAGHLMTIPDLVARLSGLHTTLTARLTLHESLLSLNGRLDMVLSQIELRSSTAPALLAPRKGKSVAAEERIASRYVEGESGSSSEEEDIAVQVQSGEDEGSVEDIELGGESEDEDEDNEADGDDDDESPTMNGFIDDEAEEYSDVDDDESD